MNADFGGRYYPTMTWHHDTSREFPIDSVHNITRLINCLENGETVDVERVNTEFYARVAFWQGNTLIFMSHPQGLVNWQAIIEIKNRVGYTEELINPDTWRWTISDER